MAEVITNQTPQIPHRSLSRNKLLLALLLVVVLAVAGWLVWRAVAKPEYSDYTYNVNQLKSYTIPGYIAKTGMSFSLPIELSPQGPLKTGQYAQRFVNDKQLPNGKYITLSYESAGIGYLQPQASAKAQAATLKSISDALNNSSNSSHTAYLNTIETFVKNNVNTRFSFTFDTVRPAITTNIKANAWELDFSGVDNKPTSKYTPTKVTGTALYAVTNGNYYYFLVASVGNNWKNNQDVWQKVLDSVKIDQ